MPATPELLIVAVVVFALAFDFSNGFHDCANAIATSVSTRVLKPRTAIVLSAILNVVGAFAGTAVAAAVGKGIVQTTGVDAWTVLAAVVSAITWNLTTWYFGIPTSSSHALIGGLVGAGIATAGMDVVLWHGVLEKILLPMLVSPLIGFAVAFLWMIALLWITRRFTVTRMRLTFAPLQAVSACYMAYSHGSNDAQKTMGIVTLALVAGGFQSDFHVQSWVIAACAAAMGLGTAAGGWRIIRTMGSRITQLMPIHGFAAESMAGSVLLGTAHFGFPVSTTHVISGAIMGVGATRKLSAVRWGVAGNIVLAWVLTLPACAILGSALAAVFRLFR